MTSIPTLRTRRNHIAGSAIPSPYMPRLNRHLTWVLAALICVVATFACSTTAYAAGSYQDTVSSDSPAARWSYPQQFSGGANWSVWRSAQMPPTASPLSAYSGPGDEAFESRCESTHISNNSLLPPSSFSAEGWVRAADGPSTEKTAAFTVIAAQYSALSDTPAHATVYSDDTGTTFHVDDGFDVLSELPVPDVDLRDGRWHHVVFTYSASTLVLYIDGARRGATTLEDLRFSYARFAGETPELRTLAHAPDLPGTWQYFCYTPVAYDELAVYTHALSNQDVAEHYNAAHAGPSDTPLRLLAAPTIDGLVETGQTLTARAGTWTGVGVTYSYQWERRRNSTWERLPGATTQQLVASANDYLRVRVTASDGRGGRLAAFSAWVRVRPPGTSPPRNVAAPWVQAPHAPKPGDVLSGARGEWESPLPLTYTYRWERDTSNGWQAIENAHALRYEVTPSDLGSRLRIVVTAVNDNNITDAASAPTNVVAVGDNSGPGGNSQDQKQPSLEQKVTYPFPEKKVFPRPGRMANTMIGAELLLSGEMSFLLPHAVPGAKVVEQTVDGELPAYELQLPGSSQKATFQLADLSLQGAPAISQAEWKVWENTESGHPDTAPTMSGGKLTVPMFEFKPGPVRAPIYNGSFGFELNATATVNGVISYKEWLQWSAMRALESGLKSKGNPVVFATKFVDGNYRRVVTDIEQTAALLKSVQHLNIATDELAKELLRGGVQATYAAITAAVQKAIDAAVNVPSWAPGIAKKVFKRGDGAATVRVASASAAGAGPLATSAAGATKTLTVRRPTRKQARRLKPRKANAGARRSIARQLAPGARTVTVSRLAVSSSRLRRGGSVTVMARGLRAPKASVLTVTGPGYRAQRAVKTRGGVAAVTVRLPKRLKPGAWTIGFVDASGRRASKPLVAAVQYRVSRNR